MEISRVYAATFEILKQRFGPLLGLLGLFTVIQVGAVIVLSVVMFAVIGGAAAGFAALAEPGQNSGIFGALGALGIGAVLAIIVVYLLFFAIFAAFQAALHHMGSPLHPADFSSSLSAGLRSALPLMGVFLLLGIGYLVIAVPISLAATAAGQAGMILRILLFPVLVYLGLRLALINPLIAVEGMRNPIEAIKRSWDLTRGNVLSIFLVYLIFTVAMILVGGIIFWPIISAAGAGGGTEMAGLGMLTILMMFILCLVVVMMSAVLPSVLHAQLSGGTDRGMAETFS